MATTTNVLLEPTLVDILAPLDDGEVKTLSDLMRKNNELLIRVLVELRAIRLDQAEAMCGTTTTRDAELSLKR